jgi:hypothetical protein
VRSHARVIATTLLQDRTLRWIVALFVFTLSFSLGALAEDAGQPSVPAPDSFRHAQRSVDRRFIYLIDYAARLLRPVSIAWRLGENGLQVIEQVYLLKIDGDHTPSSRHEPMGPPDRVIAHRGIAAIILAVDHPGLAGPGSAVGSRQNRP